MSAIPPNKRPLAPLDPPAHKRARSDSLYISSTDTEQTKIPIKIKLYHRPLIIKKLKAVAQPIQQQAATQHTSMPVGLSLPLNFYQVAALASGRLIPEQQIPARAPVQVAPAQRATRAAAEPTAQQLHQFQQRQLLKQKFFEACKNGDLEKVRELYHLIGYLDINSVFIAIQFGQRNVIQYFLSHNLNVNLKNDNGETALMIAIKYGYRTIAQDLMHHNADVNLKNNNGETALMYACARDYREIAKDLLQHNADVNVQNVKQETALMLACAHDNPEIIKMLLEHNADINKQNIDGDSALHIVCKQKYFNSFMTIVASHKPINFKIKNRKGETPRSYLTDPQDAQFKFSYSAFESSRQAI